MYKKISKLIHEADCLLIGAGAGIGVDSGMPDYRGNEGFWNAYPPLKDKNISYTDISSCEYFTDKPNMAWNFYGHCLELYRDTNPHHGFAILKEIVDQKKHKSFIFTSNVDGQFQKAGFKPENIIECHGSVHHLQCARNCQNVTWSADNTHVDSDVTNHYVVDEYPKCTHCEEASRPNVLLFTDGYWCGQRINKQQQAFNQWKSYSQQRKLKIVAIEIGAGQAVPFVRMECQKITNLIRINPEEPSPTSNALHVQLNSLDALIKIKKEYDKI